MVNDFCGLHVCRFIGHIDFYSLGILCFCDGVMVVPSSWGRGIHILEFTILFFFYLSCKHCKLKIVEGQSWGKLKFQITVIRGRRPKGKGNIGPEDVESQM